MADEETLESSNDFHGLSSLTFNHPPAKGLPAVGGYLHAFFADIGIGPKSYSDGFE